MISIHKRLLLWLLIGLLLISSIAGIATYQKMLEEVNEMQDFELRQIAYNIDSVSLSIPIGSEAVPQQTHDSDSPVFIIQVWHKNSEIQYSSQPSVPLPLLTIQGFSVVTLGDEQWQMFSLKTGERIVQTAQSMEDRQNTALEMVMRMIVPFLLLIPALAWLAWFAVRKGLAPLDRITTDIERRDSTIMQPLDEKNVPEEVRPLVVALNDFLRRLEKSLMAQRQFVADAAHELRTPLTALSLQAQLVEQEKDEGERGKAVLDLRQGILRASHLVQQLLDLARQEPDVPHVFFRLDLTELVRSKVGDLALLAAEKEIDLGVVAEQSHWINGDSASLNLLVGNLVDNAIRYIPKGSRIDVSVDGDARMVLLTVSDNGPGIPSAERERIFERFYRPAGQQTHGSGLGLAIVSEVAKLHKADIKVSQPANGHGSIFEISFNVTAPDV